MRARSDVGIVHIAIIEPHAPRRGVDTAVPVARYCSGVANIVGTGELSRMDYTRARRLLTLVGLAILAVLTVLLLVRSVDETEVIATLLFVPIFLALMYFGMVGGVLGAVIAGGIYVAMRADVIDAVGWGEFSSLIATRCISYLLFGLVGGWASGTLEQSLDKLDLYDQIDDATGAYNARFLLQDLDLERARCSRYQTVFSVSFVDFPVTAFSGLSARRRRNALRELGTRLQGSVRTVDRVAHGIDGRRHQIAVVLPETAKQGADIFHARLVESIQEFLVAQGADASVTVAGDTCTLPGDEDGLAARTAIWAAIDAAEHEAARR